MRIAFGEKAVQCLAEVVFVLVFDNMITFSIINFSSFLITA